MNNSETLLRLLRKYSYLIRTHDCFYLKGNIPSKRLDNAIKKFAEGVNVYGNLNCAKIDDNVFFEIVGIETIKELHNVVIIEIYSINKRLSIMIG